MSENVKKGCMSWIVILFVIGLIGSGIEKCSTRSERKEYGIKSKTLCLE